MLLSCATTMMGFSTVRLLSLSNGESNRKAINVTRTNLLTPKSLFTHTGNSFLFSRKYNTMEATIPARIQSNMYQEGKPVMMLKSNNLYVFQDKIITRE